MPLPTFYDTGTASVANGATAITGSATGWKGRIYAGDMFYDPAQPLVPPQRIAADATGDALTLAVAWPGTSLVGAAYEILITPDSVRVQERTREVLNLLTSVTNTGIGIDAFGLFADRVDHDAAAAGFAYLSTDGDGALVTETVVFIKNTATSADWSDAILIMGPAGEAGLIGEWLGPWVTATAYALNDVVSQGGSSYICVTAHTSGTFSTDLAASKWEIVAQKGDAGATGATGAAGSNGTNGVDGTGLFSRVRAVATANVAIATALESGDSIDGVTLATNDLVLLTGQTAPAENGVYVVAASGSAARDSSFDTYDEHPGVYVSVMEGTAKADTLWRCTSNKGGTLGTTAMTFSEFTGGGTSVPFTAASSAGPAQIDLAEDTDNGTSKISLKAPSALGADRSFVLPDMDLTLSASVQGTGRFGLDDIGGVFVYEGIAASGVGDGVALRAQANFAYTGGTAGFVNSAFAAIATAGANVTDFIWSVNAILYNNAAAGENVAGSFTAWKQGTGSTWAGVSNAADTTGSANPTGGLVSHEFDVAANGTDSNNTRLGLHVVARRHDSGGADMEAAALIRLGNTDSHALAKKGIEFYTGSLYTNAIDLSPATISGDAIKLADNQKIAFDTSDSRKLYFDGTRLHYATGSNANALRISDGGFVGVNVAPAVAFDAAGTGDTQMRLVDGGAVDTRLIASSASAVGFFGTKSNHGMVVITNDTEAFRIDTSQNLLAKKGITSSGATAGIGYATGAGGTVTQATSKTTGVTLNKATGQITMNAAALAANTTVSFTLTDSAIAAGDIIIANHISGGTAGAYAINAQSAAGAATINVRNITAGSLSEAIVIAVAVIKAVTA